MAKYLLKPVLNTVKQAFYLEEESGKTVYEGKMTKFSLFGASPFEFAKSVPPALLVVCGGLSKAILLFRLKAV